MSSAASSDDAERKRLLSEAMTQVAQDEAAIRKIQARRQLKSRRGFLTGTIVAFLLVAAWDAWMLLRPPRVPPVEQQICALKRTAGAVGAEVLAVRSARRRLPTQEELAYLLDQNLRYETTADRFAITYTDGVHVVTYDGSQPVSQWMAAGGCAVEGSAR